MRRAAIAVALMTHFLRAVIVSGLQTVRVILRHGLQRAPPRSGFARLHFEPLSASGTALLGCMVTLMPGTTIVDADGKRGELLLHMLDMSQLDVLAASLRRNFEPGVRALFGGPRA